MQKAKKRKSTETPEAKMTDIAVFPSPDDVEMSDKKKSKLKKKKNNKQKRKKDDVDENLLHSNEVGANSNHQIGNLSHLLHKLTMFFTLLFMYIEIKYVTHNSNIFIKACEHYKK